MQGRRSERSTAVALGQAGHAALGLVLALMLAVQFSTPTIANPRFAAVVVDAGSGRVVFERNADESRFPASLTKIMTLYLLFEDLKAKRVTLDTKFKASAHAAAQPPSNIGLKRGQSI